MLLPRLREVLLFVMVLRNIRLFYYMLKPGSKSPFQYGLNSLLNHSIFFINCHNYYYCYYHYYYYYYYKTVVLLLFSVKARCASDAPSCAILAVFLKMGLSALL